MKNVDAYYFSMCTIRLYYFTKIGSMICVVFKIQCIPMIATIPWYTTMLPLLFVLVVRGCKDLATDVVSRLQEH